jgi:hypothetical protein
MKEGEFLYLLYDARWHYDEDAAMVYTTEDSLKDALSMKRRYFQDAVIVNIRSLMMS